MFWNGFILEHPGDELVLESILYKLFLADVSITVHIYGSLDILHTGRQQLVILLESSHPEDAQDNLLDFIDIYGTPAILVKCSENPMKFFFSSVDVFDCFDLRKVTKTSRINRYSADA